MTKMTRGVRTPSPTGLHWSEDGEVACDSHAPQEGADERRAEGWEPLPARSAAALTRAGAAPCCRTCGRETSAAGRYRIRVRCFLNPDALPEPLADAASRRAPEERAIPCGTFDEACRVAREAQAASVFGIHLIVEIEGAGGETIAHVSQNGRIWEGGATACGTDTKEILE